MALLNIIALLVLVLYAILLSFGAMGFMSAVVFNVDEKKENHTRATIIICARNEEKNIELCLRSILNQNFNKDLIEIIVVDDASSDTTSAIVTSIFQDKTFRSSFLINAKQKGKKVSITQAIEQCAGDLIIIRDADTFTDDNNWLKTIVNFYEDTKKEFIIAPVQITSENNFLSQLQNSENLALSVITGGYAFYKKAFLCNGANLAFTKNIFNAVTGYSSHIKIASGDDVLLLEDVKKKFPETIGYLKQKSASVFTYPAQNIMTFISQRTRWAGKSKINPNPINFLMGFFVFFAHFFTLFYLSKLLFIPHLGLFGLFFVFGRLFIDFLLLFLASRFYGKGPNWLLFLPLNLMYSVCVLVITLLTLFYKPKWK